MVRFTDDYHIQNKKNIFDIFRNNGIGVNLHYIPVYFHPYYRRIGFKKGYCEEAEKYYSDAVSIPMFPSLKDEDQMKVIKTIKSMHLKLPSQEDFPETDDVYYGLIFVGLARGGQITHINVVI